MTKRTSLPVIGSQASAGRGAGAPASGGGSESGDARPEAAQPAVIQSVWMRVLMDGLRRAGVTDVVVSPGSRSTPLVFAAEFVGLRCHTIIDERSAGFFALGRAKATGVPVALLCTSGTAGAHYYPAIIEAAYSYVPLIAITADRPPELQDCAAPQTIHQTALFGSMVRHFADLGVPEADRTRLRALRRKAVQAVAVARGPVPGPVHLNVPARKPLEPAPLRTAADVAMAERGDAVCSEQAPQIITSAVRAPDAALDALANACVATKRGLIACGPMPPHARELAGAVHALSQATGFPVLAEAASQVRFGNRPEQGDLLCDGFDMLLASARFRAESQPELVLQIGAPLTSGHFASLMSENPGAVHCVIAASGWNDPHSSADALVVADVVDTLRRLVTRLRTGSRSGKGAAWASRFAAGNALVWQAVDQVLGQAVGQATETGPGNAPEPGAGAAERMREGQAMRAILGAIPAGALLALGNSLPVRTADTYHRARAGGPAVLTQRGASGIDGLISSAAGAASTGDRPVALILGDVSFTHDLGGLAAARLLGKRSPLAVIVIDNQGGRIFEQLPIADLDATLFSTHWLTPPACDVRAAATVFGHAYVRAEDPGALSEAVVAALRPEAGCTVIHALVDPESAAADAQRIQAIVDAGMDALPPLDEPGPQRAE